MNDNVCAPGKYDEKNNTCFSLEQLIELAGAYNRYILKNNIGKSADIIIIKPDKKFLLKELHTRFDNICSGNEICITKQNFMNSIISKELYHNIINNTFRPNGPTKGTEWLSSVDIEQIMKQYEDVHPDFKFIGAVASDCDQVQRCALYSLNFDKFLK